MSIDIRVDAFLNWPAFERKLREALAAQLEPDVVERVALRTRRSFKAMQLREMADSLDVKLTGSKAGYEPWSMDVRAAKTKVLSMLIDSFVAIERSRER